MYKQLRRYRVKANAKSIIDSAYSLRNNAEQDVLQVCGNAQDSGNISIPEEGVVANVSTKTRSNKPSSDADTDISNSLACWTTKHSISDSAMKELLQLLRPYIPNLPSDPRTLKKTPNDVRSVVMGGGSYIHYGLRDSLTDFMLQNSDIPENIVLHFNIDGLPLFKSSRFQLWPILCNVATTPNVLLIGVFGGKSKPNNSDIYLQPFVDELNSILSTGFVFCGKTYNVSIGAFVCDAPARSFILRVKSHTGYFSCTKCEQKGIYLNHRLLFPLERCSLRSNISFRNRLQPEHHLKLTPIILESLPIDMIDSFPLDYMHVVCLGVMRTLLLEWAKKKSLKLQLSNNLTNTKNQIPSDFNRKPRGLDEVDRWKATEFRQFLLYTGPCILSDLLSPSLYVHFLKLSLALRILLTHDDCINNNECAKKLLLSFVRDVSVLYSDNMLTYNFHCLTHLNSDALKYGSLDNICAFKFENFLQQVKKTVKNGTHVVEQVYNRWVEKSIHTAQKQHCEFPVYGKSLSNGTYTFVCTRNFKLSVREPDNFILVNKSVYKLQEIRKNAENDAILCAAQVFDLEPLFHAPINSMRLNIYRSKTCEITAANRQFNIQDVDAKCFHFCNSDNFSHYFLPIINTKVL